MSALVISPVCEVHVYRVYIVFAFSVRMFVCLSVCVSVKIFLSKFSQEQY